MTNFWWVRHGPTHAKTMVGWTDLPADLSDTEALADLNAYLPPDAPVVSSTLSRAVATADAIQGARTRLPHDPDLREFHYGDWENAAFDQIDSPALRQYFEDPGPHRAPGGESWNDVSERVTNATERLIGTAENIIIVAHMGVILTQWAQAKRITPYQALGQKISNLSVTKITLNGAETSAHFANHIP